jgi:hypothetical protein
MAVGIFVTIGDINARAGVAARDVTHAINQAMNMKRFMDRYTSAQLVTAYGGTTGDWDIVKSAFTEFGTINTTFQANRAFIDQLSGMGDV